jgi:hypothetical protein
MPPEARVEFLERRVQQLQVQEKTVRSKTSIATKKYDKIFTITAWKIKFIIANITSLLFNISYRRISKSMSFCSHLA